MLCLAYEFNFAFCGMFLCGLRIITVINICRLNMVRAFYFNKFVAFVVFWNLDACFFFLKKCYFFWPDNVGISIIKSVLVEIDVVLYKIVT